MSAKPISQIELSPTLFLSQCRKTSRWKGEWWLYDEELCMNLARGEATEQEAFVKAITYYQNKVKSMRKEFNELRNKVDTFCRKVGYIEEDDCDCYEGEDY